MLFDFPTCIIAAGIFAYNKQKGLIISSAIAGVGMAVVTALLFFAHTEVVINVAVSTVVYFALLWMLREPLLLEMKRIVMGAERSMI